MWSYMKIWLFIIDLCRCLLNQIGQFQNSCLIKNSYLKYTKTLKLDHKKIKNPILKMDKRYEQTPHQRKYIDGKVQYNLLLMKWKLTQQWDTIKTLENNNWKWGCRATETLIYCWWGCKMLQPLCKRVWQFLIILNFILPYDPLIVLEVSGSSRSSRIRNLQSWKCEPFLMEKEA